METLTIAAVTLDRQSGWGLDDYHRAAAREGVTPSWLFIIGEQVIAAEGNRSAVVEAARLAGKPVPEFDGGIRVGFRRETRQAIACLLGLAWQDVRASRKEVSLNSGGWYWN